MLEMSKMIGLCVKLEISVEKTKVNWKSRVFRLEIRQDSGWLLLFKTQLMIYLYSYSKYMYTENIVISYMYLSLIFLP